MTGLEGGASAFGNPPVHPLILVQTTAKIPAPRFHGDMLRGNDALAGGAFSPK